MARKSNQWKRVQVNPGRRGVIHTRVYSIQIVEVKLRNWKIQRIKALTYQTKKGEEPRSLIYLLA